MLRPEPIQFIATSRQRAIDLLVHRFGLLPILPEFQVADDLDVQQSEVRCTADKARHSGELEPTSGDFRMREVTLEIVGADTVRVTCSRLTEPSRTVVYTLDIVKEDVDSAGRAIAMFMARDEDPPFPRAGLEQG